MGCGSSREVGASSVGNDNSLSATDPARLVSTHPVTSQTPLSQNTEQIPSPATSRAALNPTSSTSLPSASALSSPSPSTNRHRHRGVTGATSSNLSEHYNLPLQLPRPWKSQSRTWTPSQLRRERQDFFDTRVAGQREVWHALRQVVECIRERDLPTAQGILDAVNATTPTGHIEDGCYDERGYLYKLPEEVVTNPINVQPDEGEVDGDTVVEIPASTKAKLSADALDTQTTSLPKTTVEKQETVTPDKGKDAMPDDAMQLKCRLSDRGSDVASHIRKTENVAKLIGRLRDLVKIPAYARIEIFYLGKKLDQKKALEEQDYVQGHVLNVFIVGAPK